MGLHTCRTYFVHIRFVLVFFTCIFGAWGIQAQSSEVTVSVNWPNYSAENKLEVYDGATLIASFCDTANCFTSIFDDTNYSETINLGCLPDGDGYSVLLYDFGDDGWDGNAADNPGVFIYSAGVFIFSNTGLHADGNGISFDFSVSGGGAPCTPTNTFSGIVYSDLDGNQVFGGADTGLTNAVVELFEDVDLSGTVSMGDISIGTQTTDSNGEYAFDLNQTYGGVASTVLFTPQDDARNGNSTENKLPLGLNQDVGVRFRNITIPANATVTSAYLYFTSKQSSGQTGSVEIYGENEALPADYTPLDNVSSRTRTTAKEDWTFSNWYEDEEVQTSDIASVINELIADHGTYTNGIMNFLLIGNGVNDINAKSFETNGDEHQAPRLVIYYSLPYSYQYVAQVDTNSLPADGSLTANNFEIATYTAEGQVQTNNNFGFAYDPPPMALVGLAKAVTDVQDNGDGTFDVTYILKTESLGDSLFDLEIIDNLSAEFGTYKSSVAAVDAPGEYTLSANPSITASTGGASIANVNQNFDGIGNQNLVNPALGESMPTNSTLTIEYSIHFYPTAGKTAFQSQASAKGDTSENGTADGDTSDLSDDGACLYTSANPSIGTVLQPEPDTDGDGNPDESGENDPTYFHITPSVNCPIKAGTIGF